MCSFGPDAVFAVYTDDERPRETVGPGHDLEEGMYGIGLGVFSNGLTLSRVTQGSYFFVSLSNTMTSSHLHR